MDQIGLALSRRKLPRKPFSRRVCLAGCALDSVVLPLLLPLPLRLWPCIRPFCCPPPLFLPPLPSPRLRARYYFVAP